MYQNSVHNNGTSILSRFDDGDDIGGFAYASVTFSAFSLHIYICRANLSMHVERRIGDRTVSKYSGSSVKIEIAIETSA